MSRSLSVGYLRGFITLLVVAHHALLAYHPFAPAPSSSLTAGPRLWPVFPVSDAAKTIAAAIFTSFNDIFFMSLMFLLSGVFVWQSLTRKGAGAFLRDRGVRLGVPFLLAPVILAPLAYFPWYLQTTATPTAAGFVDQWLALGFLPAGPAWFLWVLLAFDLLAAGLFAVLPQAGPWLGQIGANAGRRPWRFLGMLMGVSALGYLPMVLAFDAMRWETVGPFAFQTARILHYLAYFVVGIGVGMAGLDRGLLEPAGRLPRRWWLWVAASVVVFVVVSAAFLTSMSPEAPALPWEAINAFGFVLSCAVTSMAMAALFVRFSHRSAIFDRLTDDAYAIYVVHYIVVSWVQYALLAAAWPGGVKAAVAVVGAIALSWALAAAVRRIPVIARVI